MLVEDDVLNDGKTTKSTGGFRNNSNTETILKKGFEGKPMRVWSAPTDVGSFSRFFSLDAWWERKIQELPEEVQKTFPFIIVPKASKSEKNEGLERFEEVIRNEGRDEELLSGKMPRNRSNEPKKNFHPSVKPIKLMSYLITLGSREGDLILEPFSGSGTTLVATKMLKRNFIGFEREADYFKIAQARIDSFIPEKGTQCILPF